MTNPIPTKAAEKGLTRHVYVSNDECDIFGYIAPDAETDGTFLMYDEDQGDFIKVNGWQASEIEDIPEAQPMTEDEISRADALLEEVKARIAAHPTPETFQRAGRTVIITHNDGADNGHMLSGQYKIAFDDGTRAVFTFDKAYGRACFEVMNP